MTTEKPICDPQTASILESSIQILGGSEVARQTVYAIYALGKFDGALSFVECDKRRQDAMQNLADVRDFLEIRK